MGHFCCPRLVYPPLWLLGLPGLVSYHPHRLLQLPHHLSFSPPFLFLFLLPPPPLPPHHRELAHPSSYGEHVYLQAVKSETLRSTLQCLFCMQPFHTHRYSSITMTQVHHSSINNKSVLIYVQYDYAGVRSLCLHMTTSFT